MDNKLSYLPQPPDSKIKNPEKNYIASYNFLVFFVMFGLIVGVNYF